MAAAAKHTMLDCDKLVYLPPNVPISYDIEAESGSELGAEETTECEYGPV